jgi:hypothetical protein
MYQAPQCLKTITHYDSPVELGPDALYHLEERTSRDGCISFKEHTSNERHDGRGGNLIMPGSGDHNLIESMKPGWSRFLGFL